MKLPPRRAVSAAMALSSLRARDPIVFEKSFQTLTASSLSWIDDGLTSLEAENSVQNEADEENAAIELASPGSSEDQVLRHHHRVVAEALIRRKVFKILDKYDQGSDGFRSVTRAFCEMERNGHLRDGIT